MNQNKAVVQGISILNWIVYVFVGLNLVFYSDYAIADLQFKLISTLAVVMISTYVSWLFINPSAGILLLQFWIFNSIFFVLAPIAVISNPSSWFVNSSLDQGTKIQAFYLIMGALLISFIGSQSRVKLTNRPQLGFLIDIKRYKFFFISYVILFVVLIIFGQQFIANSLVDYSSGRAISPVSPMESGLMRAFLVAIPMIFLLCILRLGNRISPATKIVVSFISLTILFIFANPLGNSRQTFLLAFLPIVFASISGNFVLGRLIAFLIFLVTIFGQPVSYAITHSAQNFRLLGFEGVFNSFSFKPSQILTGGDFDSFGMFATGLTHLGPQNFNIPFSQFFGVVFYWVPRSLWPGKPQDTAVEIATLASFRFQNLSAPWLLELLANGGLVLVLLGAFLIPRALKKFDLFSNNHDFKFLLTYLLIGSEFILLRGSLLQASGVVIFGLVLSRFLVKKNQ